MNELWIEPNRFALAMETHRHERLENISSPALFETWRWMAEHCKSHIQDHDTANSNRWCILSPPTSAGKTQGSTLCCAMLTDREPSDPPGALIVTNRVQDCQIIAAEIDSFSFR